MIWTSVNDKLPENEGWVLGYDDNGWMWIVMFYENAWEDMLDRQMKGITHWMPLPEVPE
jgi:hypothetical protein